MQWIAKFGTDLELASFAYKSLHPALKEKIWNCNLNKLDASKIFNEQDFWGSILITWSEFHYSFPQTFDEACQQPIWYNSCIKVHNKVLSPVLELISRGIWKIKDIVNTNCRQGLCCMSWDQMKNRYAIPNKFWLWYQGLSQSLPRIWKYLVNQDGNDSSDMSVDSDECNISFSYKAILPKQKCSAYI